MSENNDSKKKLFVLISLISVVLLVVVVVCCIMFLGEDKEVINESIDGGNVVLSYTEKSNTLVVKNLTPVSDNVAINDLKGDNYFEFSVDTKVTDANSITYELSVRKNTQGCTINDKDIRIYLEKENSGSYTAVFGPEEFSPLKKTTNFGSLKGDMVLTKVTNKKSTIENYRLKVWLNENAVPSEVSQDYSVDIILSGNAR